LRLDTSPLSAPISRSARPLARRRDAGAVGIAQERAARAPAARASRGATDAEKQAAATEKLHAREVTAAERAAKRAADAKIREAERSAAYVYRIQQRYFNQQQRDEERADRKRARDRERTSDRRMGAMVGIGKDLAIGAASAIGGGFLGMTGAAGREAMKLQDLATRIAINARGAGEEQVNATTLRKEFENTAIANPGVKATDIAEGVASFVAKTGDLATARSSMGTFATVASATGASVSDIAGTGADLMGKFGIKSDAEMKQALASLTFQGKSGAFELKDAAALFPKVGAAASRFGLGQGVESVKTLGGMMQIARSATGSGEGAATAVEAMFRQMIKKSPDLKKMGVDVFEKGSKGTKTRDFQEVLIESIAKSGGSLPKLQKVFDTQGIRAISPLIADFNNAKNAAKASGKNEKDATAAGVDALKAALDKAINAPGDWAEVVKDAAAAQRIASASVTASWERIKSIVGDKLAPKMAEILGKLANDPKAIEAFGNAIEIATTSIIGLYDGVNAVVGFLKEVGIIKDKPKSPMGAAGEAQDALAKFDEEKGFAYGPMAGGPSAPLTPMEAAKRAELEAQVKKAQAAVFDPNVGGPNETMAQFGKRYAEAGDKGFLESALRLPRGIAAASAAAIDATGLTNMTGNDFFRKTVLGENEQQQQIFRDAGFTGGGSSEMKAAADKLSAAADKLSAANPGATLTGNTPGAPAAATR
jgi:hypothetical protein